MASGSTSEEAQMKSTSALGRPRTSPLGPVSVVVDLESPPMMAGFRPFAKLIGPRSEWKTSYKTSISKRRMSWFLSQEAEHVWNGLTFRGAPIQWDAFSQPRTPTHGKLR